MDSLVPGSLINKLRCIVKLLEPQYHTKSASPWEVIEMETIPPLLDDETAKIILREIIK